MAEKEAEDKAASDEGDDDSRFTASVRGRHSTEEVEALVKKRDEGDSLLYARVSLYLLLEEPGSSRPAWFISLTILTTIIFSIICFMIETMPEFKNVSDDVWEGIELTCTLVFTTEYVLRFLVCDVNGISKRKFVSNPVNILDVLAILPFWLQVSMSMAVSEDALREMEVLRVLRLFRIFKLGRYSSGMRLMGEALGKSSQALSVLMFFLCIGVILFSSALYNVERISCPQRKELAAMNATQKYIEECMEEWAGGFSATYGLCCDEHDSPNDFPSIIETFWWSIVTMTTVGFGEVFPKTWAGQVVGTITMLAGLLLISLPVAIVGREFQDVYEAHAARVGDRKMFGQDSGGGGKAMRRASGSDPAQMRGMGRKLRAMRISDPMLSCEVRELSDLFDEVEATHKLVQSLQTADIDRELEIHQQFDTFITAFTESIMQERKARGEASKHSPGSPPKLAFQPKA